MIQIHRAGQLRNGNGNQFQLVVVGPAGPFTNRRPSLHRGPRQLARPGLAWPVGPVVCVVEPACAVVANRHLGLFVVSRLGRRAQGGTRVGQLGPAGPTHWHGRPFVAAGR